MATVDLDQVRKTYPGGVEAVVGVDLAIGDGEFLAILGPSGSGKTTILRLVSGLESADSGSIRIGGQDVSAIPPDRRDVAMVFQGPTPLPHLDVFENLAFGLRARRHPRAEIAPRVEEIAGLLGLSAVLRRRPDALSGGQRQRVALGRALARRPKVLLLDEPFSSLDAPLRTALRDEIAEIRRRMPVTTILVTHDQEEALALGDRVAVMDSGRIAQIDSPQILYRDPATRFVAEFVGNPPMGLLRAEIAGGETGPGVELADDQGASTFLPLPGRERSSRRRPVWLGVRPEAVSISGEFDPKSLTGKVLRIEPRGPDQLVTVSVGDRPIRLRTASGAAPRVGDRVPLSLDLARASLFDGETGERIGP